MGRCPNLRIGQRDCGAEERAAIEVAAQRAGKPVTQWAREALTAATRAS